MNIDTALGTMIGGSHRGELVTGKSREDLRSWFREQRSKYGAKIRTMRASDVKPITYMKTHSAELVAAVNEKRSPVVITQNGEPRAVVMDVASYERIGERAAAVKKEAKRRRGSSVVTEGGPR